MLEKVLILGDINFMAIVKNMRRVFISLHFLFNLIYLKLALWLCASFGDLTCDLTLPIIIIIMFRWVLILILPFIHWFNIFLLFFADCQTERTPIKWSEFLDYSMA